MGDRLASFSVCSWVLPLGNTQPPHPPALRWNVLKGADCHAPGCTKEHSSAQRWGQCNHTHAHRWGHKAVCHGHRALCLPPQSAWWSHCPEWPLMIHTSDPAYLQNGPQLGPACGHTPCIAPSLQPVHPLSNTPCPCPKQVVATDQWWHHQETTPSVTRDRFHRS